MGIVFNTVPFDGIDDAKHMPCALPFLAKNARTVLIGMKMLFSQLMLYFQFLELGICLLY